MKLFYFGLIFVVLASACVAPDTSGDNKGTLPTLVQPKQDTTSGAAVVNDLVKLDGQEKVNSVAWSPDGKFLASARKDLTVKIWDVSKKTEIKKLEGNDVVKSASWSSDGKFLALGSEDNKIRIVDTSSWNVVKTLEGHEAAVNFVAFSPDGKKISSASDDKTIRIWDAVTGAELKNLKGHTSSVSSLAWKSDGSKIASLAHGIAHIWDVSTGSSILEMDTERYSLTAIAWSPDSKLLWIGGGYSSSLWDSVSGAQTKNFEDEVDLVSWSSDGKYISIVGRNYVTLSDPSTFEEKKILKFENSGYSAAFSWSPDGKKIAVGSDKGIYIWDVSGISITKTLKLTNIEPDPSESSVSYDSDIKSFSWSPDGKKMATKNGDGTIRVWDSEKWTELLKLKPSEGYYYDLSGDGWVAWGPDGKKIFAWSPIYINNFIANTGMRVWDSATGSELNKFEYGRAERVLWNLNGNKGILSIKDEDSVGGKDYVATVDAGGKETKREEAQYKFKLSSWSPDGKKVVGTSGGSVAILDGETLKKLKEVSNYQANIDGDFIDTLWSKDGKFIIAPLAVKYMTTPKATIILLDANALLVKKNIDGIGAPIALSPDGSRLAAVSADSAILIYDASSWSPKNILRGFAGGVKWIEWSPDGKRVAANSGKVLKIWNVG